ncbi:MAG: helix-turn-helix domain-containing protein [Candidatus Woesearchaeota archaeon]
MWIAKFRMRHDCILGNRTRKFGVTVQGVAFSVFKEKGKVFSSSMFYCMGEESQLKKFFIDLKKDKSLVSLEQRGSMFFMIEKAESRAVQFYHPKLIFVKPVLVDTDGFEHWEVASWEKSIVSKFINQVEKHIGEFKLLRFTEVPINTVFFPKLMPDLTDKQRFAVELAIKEGYYATPRRTDLRKLAKLMKISLATYEQHLRVAEEKLIPNALSYAHH